MAENQTIATSLLAIAASIEQLSLGKSKDRSDSVPNLDQSACGRVRRYLTIRRQAKQIIGQSLFSDPAWDILLSLYLNAATSRPMDIKTVALDTDSPQTTVIRWLAELEKHQLVTRSIDPNDRRRVIVTLTPAAKAKIEEVWQPGQSSSVGD